MSDRVCLVHYHEIGLKGKNRSLFENQLVQYVRSAMRDFDLEDVRRISGHILVTFKSGATAEEAHLLSRVPGVARVSLAIRTGLVVEDFLRAATEALSEVADFSSFKVHARRSSTNFEIHTLELNKLVGAELCRNFPDKKVDVHTPDVTVYVMVVTNDVYVYADANSTVGVGGLPVGTAGKVITLLSSGFDSPVATWMVGRRGANCVPLHFSGRPMTPDTSEYLTQDIIHAMAPSGMIGRLYVVPFGEKQREISLVVPQNLRIIMYRRVMFAVAERLAQLEGAKAIVTGESLGQVASQTLENITAVNEMCTIPIFRPLIGSDKQEILKRAQEIDTFDISAQDVDDCCTLFMPRKPETHARMDQVHAVWDSFDHKQMIDDLVGSIEYVDFDQCPSYKPPKCLRHKHTELAPAWKTESDDLDLFSL